MNKILHVAVREFLATVVTKGFLIGLVIMPLVILIAVVGMGFLLNEEAPRVEGEVAVLDPTGAVLPAVEEYLRPERIAERRDDFEKLVEESTPEALEKLPGASAEARQRALGAVLGQVPDLAVVELTRSADLEAAKASLLDEPSAGARSRLAVIRIHDDAIERATEDARFGTYDLFIREKLDDRVVGEIRDGVRDAIVDARVARAGLDRARIDSLIRVDYVRSKTVTETGEREIHEELALFVPGAFMLLLFVSVMTSGQSLMTTTVEEKSSRVVEVLLSAVSPLQLMTGKILGQLCVGFVILAVYAAMGMATLVSFALMSLIDPWQLVYLVLFYLLAHFMIASLLGSIGAAVNDMREAQNLMGPVMVVFIVPWVLWLPISRNPDSTFAVITSFVPPLSPFVMMIRVASSTPPPLWQVWLSIAIGALAVYGALWFAAKVFRIGLLMFGKPPNFRTLVRWVRMA